MTICDLEIGQYAVISAVGGEGALRQHFLDMGLIPGIEVTLIKYAPMGDPMELMVSGYPLTLRWRMRRGLISPTCTSTPAAGEKCWNPFSPARTFLTRESVKRAEEENETEMYRKIISFSHWREIRIAAKPPCSTS